MTDQQNFEAPRPVSADPAVALAEMLGQLPVQPVEAPTAATVTNVKIARRKRCIATSSLEEDFDRVEARDAFDRRLDEHGPVAGVCGARGQRQTAV